MAPASRAQRQHGQGPGFAEVRRRPGLPAQGGGGGGGDSRRDSGHGHSSAAYRGGSGAGPSAGLVPPLESDASLHDLLAPLVAERVRRNGGLSPPSPLEVPTALAAISAVVAPPSHGADNGASAAERGAFTSHFESACKSLGMQGFRTCSLVADKLGVSIRCKSSPQDHPERGCPEEQVDFPWSSISDVQDPRPKPGLQGCAVTLGVREPTRLFEGSAGALALVLRLPDRETAQRLADAALAFKAYETQTSLFNARGRGGPPARGPPPPAGASASVIAGGAALLLDERGGAFWSMGERAEGMEAAKAGALDPLVGGGVQLEGASLDDQQACCTLCWC